MTGLLPSTTYYVRAYATNSAGTSYGANVSFSTLCEVIAPLPDFAASKLNLTVGESINFFDSTKFCPDSWNWSFNGGNPSSSTLQNPTGITYNFSGDYTVCLTATNQWGQQTSCKTAYIHVIGPTNAPVVITELNYRSPLGGTDSLEFIELYNNGSQDVDLHNFYFSKGIEFTFPAMILHPQSYVLISKSASFMTNYYNVPAYQWNAGSALSNGGEAVVLKDYFGFVVDSLSYLPSLPWDTMANGKGPSLELCDPNANNTQAANWRHAIEYKAKTPAGDSLWASPLAGCAYLPVAKFLTSDSTINTGQSVIFTDASTGSIDSWFWEFERGVPETFSGQAPPPVTYNIMGAYDVTLTIRNAAGKSVKYKPAFIQVGPSGIAASELKAGFSINPNPAPGGRFKIAFDHLSDFDVTITSGIGTLVHSRTVNTREAAFELSDLPKGVYFIKVKDNRNAKTDTQKIIIQ
jgi:PKD repeat protein